MGAKGKYCHEVVQQIVDIVAQTGSDKAGYEATGISKDTFYRWLKDPDKPGFADRIVSAKREYRRVCPDELIRKANQRLSDALDAERRSVRSTTLKRTIHHYSADGTLRWYQEVEENAEHNEQLPVPPWAIDRVIPKAVHTLQQLMMVASEYGLKLEIADADLFNKYLAICHSENAGESGREQSGISPQTAEQIRREIMGIESEPTRSAAVSE